MYHTDRVIIIRLADTGIFFGSSILVVSGGFIGSILVVSGGFVGSSLVGDGGFIGSSLVGSGGFIGSSSRIGSGRVSTRPLERLGICLCPQNDSLSKSRIEERSFIICWILGLNETIEFGIPRTFLTEHRVPIDRRLSGKILRRETSISRPSWCIYYSRTYRGRILFGLTELLCEGNHLGLCCSIKLLARI